MEKDLRAKSGDDSAKRGSIVKGTVQISSTQIIQYIVFATFYIVVTKTGAVTEAELGIISMLHFMVQALETLTSFSLPSALTKYVSEDLEKGLTERAASIQKTINRLVIVLFTVGYGLAAVLSPQISQLLWNTEAYWILVVLMCLHGYFIGLMNLYNSSLQALRLFGKVATVTLSWVLISRLLGMALAILNLGIYGVLIGYVVGYGVACGTSIVFTKGKLPNSKNYFPLKPLLIFSFPLFLGTSLRLILNWADVVFVSSLTTDFATVGIYYIAVESASFLSALWLPFTFTVFPLLSGRHGLQDFHGISEIVKATSRYLMYLLVPCCMGLAFLAPTALRFFYSEGYVSGAASLAILSFAQLFMSIYFLLTTALTAIGKTSSVFKVNIVSALTYLTFLFLLVPFFQDVGAASAKLGMLIVTISVAVYALGRYVKVRFSLEALWKSVVSSLAMLLAILLIQNLTSGLSVYLKMLLEIAAGGISYLLFLILLKALNHQDFELLRKAFPSLKKYITISERIISR